MGILSRLDELTKPREPHTGALHMGEKRLEWGESAERAGAAASSVGHRLGRGLQYEAVGFRHHRVYRRHPGKHKRRHRRNRRGRRRRSYAPFDLGLRL
jgi:hypothetical protein